MSIISVAKANLILNYYSITSPNEIDLETIAFDKGLIIQEKDISGCEGRLIRNDKCGIIIVDSKICELGKKRFVIAHELGHFELKHNNNKVNICDETAFFQFHKNGPTEIDANDFASELLMPKNMFLKLSRNKPFNKDLIIYLAKTFQTSLTATALRYVDFGQVPIAVIYSQDKIIKWGFCSKSFHITMSKQD